MELQYNKKIKHPKNGKRYPLFISIWFSLKGIAKAIKKERNLKIHLGFTFLVLILGLIFKVSQTEWLILVLTIAIVISAEIFNSAIEAVSDLLKFKLKLSYYETYWIRNFAAGGVMILAIASVIIGFIIFLPKIF
ncbi:hypothetical protein COT75_05500 [Candidatus Beckwithbacteria bacterium CG10_big_fil_rev_8_21_14_0_10_34_10]|uniref:Diacylglycerol kinase n=1 Tax=Candidatus Beckwithbacteria bacterium CG10_big_fil_rev_8_21_14_0_10_34_10 TaxID=1974495 RepID=A0A2H0W7P5_9BACT|nr:MAG: hypothetical protein COT75_05500 [Candidatus Beckwithbacteria bacterium CG10_big_fil_rev_8_21_14_0_10_34_10]